MKKLAGIALSIGLFFAAPLAHAVTPSEISDVLEAQGYPVHAISESMLAVNYQGMTVLIAINGADGDVSYLTYLQNGSDNVSEEFLNNYNYSVKFGRAFIDRDGDVVIQMDRNASGGVSLGNVASDFEVFISLVEKFLNDVSNQVTV